MATNPRRFSGQKPASKTEFVQAGTRKGWFARRRLSRYRRSLPTANIAHLRSWHRDLLIAFFAVDGYRICVILAVMAYCIGMGALCYHLLHYLESLVNVHT